MRRLRASVAAGLIVAGLLLVTQRQHVPIDPDEPLAADGSLAAGKARTIYDIDPALGAPDPPIKVDSDDPNVFRRRFEEEAYWTARARPPMLEFLDRSDVWLCEDANRERLVEAVKTYYDIRGRQKASFSGRGPRAREFIAQAWATPLDQRIDAFARRVIMSGILDAYLPRTYHPELAEAAAGAKPVGAACPPLKIERRPRLPSEKDLDLP